MRHVRRGESLAVWAAVLALLAGSSAAWAGEPVAPAPVVPAPAAPAADTATDQEHWAKGEVKYGDAWVQIDTLFKDYLAALAELQDVNQKGEGVKARLAELTRQTNVMRSEANVAERPVRFELSKAKAKQRDLNEVLDKKPPARPVLIPPPPRPRIVTSSQSGSNYGGYNSSADNQFQEWERKCDIINRQNQQVQQKYQQDLAMLKKAQDDARKDLPKVETTVKDCEGKLAQSAADLQTKTAPIVEQSKTINDEVTAANRHTSAVETRLKAMTEALRAAPETLRLQHGIVEWEGLFRAAAELEKLYVDTQAEINRVRDQLKAEAAKGGPPFPADWRHPQQDRMDALKALVDKAKAAQAAAPKPAAAPAV